MYQALGKLVTNVPAQNVVNQVQKPVSNVPMSLGSGSGSGPVHMTWDASKSGGGINLS